MFLTSPAFNIWTILCLEKFVLKYVIPFYFQLRRMQEMIAQMQAQMKSQS